MPAERLVLTFAGRQHGMITSAQLAEAGWGRHAVAHRVRIGWLRRKHRGVYLVGPLETPLTAAMAAVLAAGDGALLGHYPAAVLWGLRPPRTDPMHVTVLARDVRSAEFQVHRVAGLHPGDATRRHGIPVTSPARTLLDLATTLSHNDLDRAVNEAQVHHLVSDRSLSEQFSRYPRHRGTRALKEAIRIDPALTRSEAERRALR